MSRVPDSRAERLAAAAAAAELDAVVVGDLVHPGDSGREAMADVTWLTGFRGSSAVAVVGPGVRTFLTDFRYLTTAAETVPESFRIVEATGEILPALAAQLAGRVGVDESKVSVSSHAKLGAAIADGVELTGAEAVLADLRRVKDDSEIERIAAAARLTDEVYGWIEERGLAGRAEREVALAAEARMRELGAEAPAFPSIVAAGENGALPHAMPGDRTIGAGEYVVVDMGAILDGYCSDCTRTIVEGEPEPSEREVYELVLAAQEAALDAIRPGVSARAVDAVAREVISEAGYGERFGHGVGHGVGIEVHEGPRLSKRSDDTLMIGDVVTVEPGVYLPGDFGVRIEDLVVVIESGIRNLSGRPK